MELINNFKTKIREKFNSLVESGVKKVKLFCKKYKKIIIPIAILGVVGAMYFVISKIKFIIICLVIFGGLYVIKYLYDVWKRVE